MEQASEYSSGRPRPPGGESVEDRLDALTPDAVERVIRRAIQLQSDADVGTPPLDRASIERIAGELGVGARFVRQALGEELSRPDPEPDGVLDRLFAPSRMQERQVVEVGDAELEHLIATWMTKHEGMRPSRHLSDGVVWVKDPSPLTSIRQGLKLSQGSGALRTVGSVTHRVDPVDDRRKVVVLEADTTRLKVIGLSVAGGLSAGGVIAAGITAGAEPDWTAETIAIATAFVAANWAITVASVKTWASKVREGLGRAVDAIAHPEEHRATESVPQMIGRLRSQWREIRRDARRGPR